MTFAFPTDHAYIWFGAGILVLFVLGVVLRQFEARRARRLNAFVEAELSPRLLVGYESAMRRPLTWLTLLGFAFLGLAMAQPHWGASWQPVHRYSRDIVVCIDTSRSMSATDILPNRMTRAKQKIAALVDAAPSDRFGLIAFAGGAALQCPLTLDHAYFKAVLDAVDTNTISLEGTDIAAALDQAVKTLRGDESDDVARARRNERAILLVTDGEQVKGNAVEQARKAAPFCHVYVLGVGSPEGAEVSRPAWMSRYLPRSTMSETHDSKLNEGMLTAVAIGGDGRYVRSTPDDYDIGQLTTSLNGLAGHGTKGDLRLRRVNRYQWPLAAALACFAAEGAWLVLMPWLRRRRRARRGKAAAGERQYA